MADSTVVEVGKMKVVDLRKELKSRGLSYAGDKAELVARLQAAMSADSQDEHADINLDSDEIDSDGVLEDEDDKSHGDILDDPSADTINEELALAEQPPAKEQSEAKPNRILKRKITLNSTKEDASKSDQAKEPGAKKIVLNRSASISALQPVIEKTEDKEELVDAVNESTASNKIKITAAIDTKTRMEMRAKRFGLPVKVSDAERKEARKQRFGQITTSAQPTTLSASSNPASLTENLDKLKKRAERFGQSVSKIMTDIENKEKIEKRKAKFGMVK